MTKINMLSSVYWENLFHDLKGLLKVYPIQVLLSLIVSVAVAFIFFLEGQVFFPLFWGISYFFGTNLLLLIVSEKIENGMAQNTVSAHVLFGTSTNRLKLSGFYWVLKGIVVLLKYMFAPFLLIIGLFQYQSILNKIMAKRELENYE